jgi:hypothetical protein
MSSFVALVHLTLFTTDLKDGRNQNFLAKLQGLALLINAYVPKMKSRLYSVLFSQNLIAILPSFVNIQKHNIKLYP